MKSFFSPRHIRYTAIAMLFVWLMTFGIGIANACLVNVAQGHHGASEQVQAHHHHHADADEHSSSTDKAVCATVCAEEQAATIKIKPLDAPSESLGVPVTWFPALTVALVDPHHQSAPLVPAAWYELPVSIRVLRLTI